MPVSSVVNGLSSWGCAGALGATGCGGGAIIGCSTAYHLAKLGWTDTVLLERKKLTSGTTFHAAGLVGQLRSNANITQLLGYSVDLYNKASIYCNAQASVCNRKPSSRSMQRSPCRYWTKAN